MSAALHALLETLTRYTAELDDCEGVTIMSVTKSDGDTPDRGEVLVPLAEVEAMVEAALKAVPPITDHVFDGDGGDPEFCETCGKSGLLHRAQAVPSDPEKEKP